MRDGDLRNLLIENIRHFHWVRVETGGITPGVPDANACWDGREVWVEAKRTSNWSITFEPLQVAWIHRRTREGGNCWIAIRRMHGGGPRRGPPVDDFYLVRGRDVIRLAQMGLQSVPWQRWTGGPAGWNWQEIGHSLMEDGDAGPTA